MGRLTEAFDYLNRKPEDMMSLYDRQFHYHYLDDNKMMELRKKYKLYKNPH